MHSFISIKTLTHKPTCYFLLPHLLPTFSQNNLNILLILGVSTAYFPGARSVQFFSFCFSKTFIPVTKVSMATGMGSWISNTLLNVMKQFSLFWCPFSMLLYLPFCFSTPWKIYPLLFFCYLGNCLKTDMSWQLSVTHACWGVVEIIFVMFFDSCGSHCCVPYRPREDTYAESAHLWFSRGRADVQKQLWLF